LRDLSASARPQIICKKKIRPHPAKPISPDSRYYRLLLIRKCRLLPGRYNI
jgi:hypothetical protein